VRLIKSHKWRASAIRGNAVCQPVAPPQSSWADVAVLVSRAIAASHTCDLPRNLSADM